jgi:hypothetical protein
MKFIDRDGARNDGFVHAYTQLAHGHVQCSDRQIPFRADTDRPADDAGEVHIIDHNSTS